MQTVIVAPPGHRAGAVKFGIHLGAVNPRLWVSVTEEADRLGFESVWIPEHLVVPIGVQWQSPSTAPTIPDPV